MLEVSLIFLIHAFPGILCVIYLLSKSKWRISYLFVSVLIVIIVHSYILWESRFVWMNYFIYAKDLDNVPLEGAVAIGRWLFITSSVLAIALLVSRKVRIKHKR